MILYELHSGRIRYLKATAAFDRALRMIGIDSRTDLVQQMSPAARDCLSAIRLGSMQAIRSGNKVMQQFLSQDTLCLLEIVYISQYQKYRIFRCQPTPIPGMQRIDSFRRQNP